MTSQHGGWVGCHEGPAALHIPKSLTAVCVFGNIRVPESTVSQVLTSRPPAFWSSNWAPCFTSVCMLTCSHLPSRFWWQCPAEAPEWRGYPVQTRLLCRTGLTGIIDCSSVCHMLEEETEISSPTQLECRQGPEAFCRRLQTPP